MYVPKKRDKPVLMSASYFNIWTTKCDAYASYGFPEPSLSGYY